MDINDLTIGQAKELAGMFGASNGQTSEGLNKMVGEKCIIRTYSAGVWFGEIEQKSGKEVIVKNARRLWRWRTTESISLSAVAVTGIDASGSDLAPTVPSVWLEAVELIPCSRAAIKTIEGAQDAKAK
tara:strand:- start:30 stop:413 length:384 start_codon:yes stop_codon:yes gene_type:complete